jgi:hypothetical protein
MKRRINPISNIKLYNSNKKAHPTRVVEQLQYVISSTFSGQPIMETPLNWEPDEEHQHLEHWH